MYKQILTPENTISTTTIRRIEDGANIPMDEANTDYQAYLRWCEEGNTPLPAEGTE